jgi:hypothetical protein
MACLVRPLCLDSWNSSEEVACRISMQSRTGSQGSALRGTSMDVRICCLLSAARGGDTGSQLRSVQHLQVLLRSARLSDASPMQSLLSAV